MKANRLFVWLGAVLLGLLILLFLLPALTYPSPLRGVLSSLPFGWWRFLGRNLPQITLNWDLNGTGFVCSALVLVLGNWLFRAMFSQFQQTFHTGQLPKRWPWRWTICIYSGIWLLFTIAFGSAGVFRHTAWLLTDPQPWYQERMGSYIELRMVDLTVQELLLDNEQDLQSMRKALGSQSSYRHKQNLITEDFNVIFYGSQSNKVSAYLIIPRNPRLVPKGQFVASRPGTANAIRPISELRQTIAELDSAYSSNGP